jgi:hypothetical protein
MQENNFFFFVFKKSMQKHIFETSNICFFNKKNVKNMLGYWPYATRKNIFYIYFFIKTQASQNKKKKKSHTHPFQNLQKAQNTDVYKKINYPKPNFTHTRFSPSI